MHLAILSHCDILALYGSRVMVGDISKLLIELECVAQNVPLLFIVLCSTLSCTCTDIGYA